MRFYAVSTEAVELTFRALQKLDRERKGSHRPSRACGWPRSLGTCNAVLEEEAMFRWAAANLPRPGICIRVKFEPISRI